MTTAEARATGTCTRCRIRQAKPGVATCQQCREYIENKIQERRDRQRARYYGEDVSYRPFDELLKFPRFKILRALRWFGWVERDALTTRIGVDISNQLERDNYTQALSRMIRDGLVLRSKIDRIRNGYVGDCALVRITDKGKRYLEDEFAKCTQGVER